MKKAVSFSFYFLYFAAMATLMPFLVLYYQRLGFSGAQIGLLTGIAPLIVLVSAPVWTGIADTTGHHQRLINLAIGGAAALMFVIPYLGMPGLVVFCLALYYCGIAPITPLADSATMAMLAGEKAKYGRVRVGGTIGFGLAAPIAGVLVQRFGLNLAFQGYTVLMLLTLIVAQRFTFGAPAAKASLRGATRTLLANRRWKLFLALAFVGGMGFASINTYLYPYLQELGASETLMGLAVTLSTLSELPVFFFADRLLRRFKAFELFVLALITTGVRLLLCAAFASPVGVLALQLLNGVTFPAAWAAGVSYADANAPSGMNATAQGLFGAMIFGFGAAAGGFCGGLLLGSLGGRAMYLIFGAAVLAGTTIITLMERRLPGEQHA